VVAGQQQLRVDSPHGGGRGHAVYRITAIGQDLTAVRQSLEDLATRLGVLARHPGEQDDIPPGAAGEMIRHAAIQRQSLLNMRRGRHGECLGAFTDVQ
jgi:hypothetical protein